MNKFQLGHYQIFFYNILAPLSIFNTFNINHRFAHQDAVQLCSYAFHIAEKYQVHPNRLPDSNLCTHVLNAPALFLINTIDNCTYLVLLKASRDLYKGFKSEKYYLMCPKQSLTNIFFWEFTQTFHQ
jgi:hypothetical protein